MKTCYKCKIEKPFTEFYKNRAQSDGYQGSCKSCKSEQARLSYYRDAEKSQQARRERHARDSYKENARSREYNRRNQEKLREYNKKWYSDNKEHVKVYAQDYYQIHGERCRDASKRWRACNPDKVRYQKRKRRALLYSAAGSFGEWVVRYYRYSQSGCFYCGEAMLPEAPASDPRKETLEHIIPLSRGGSHSWDNTALACRSCNLRKHNKLPEEVKFDV